MDNPYFERTPPKSLDRDDFALDPLSGLDVAEGAATLTAFTARAVAKARELLPSVPNRWLVCGGGRHNKALMAGLAEALSARVEPVDSVGWRGDALEAEAFAFMAVRHLNGLPITFPGTTGVAAPLAGGVLHPHEE
jgi:anhydro-N-acetylmuramic acid kinase